MKKADFYRHTLATLADWQPFLLQESGLPGPRGNLELAQLVADMGDEALFRQLLVYTPDKAPANSPHEFLAFCGVVGLGKLLAQGNLELLATLRRYACDPRWRIREAVVMALERLGHQNMSLLVNTLTEWSRGTLLERRAAACGLCQPELLHGDAPIQQILSILNAITASLQAAPDRKSEDFKALRKGLAYCWSVAVAAFPAAGKPVMEKWLATDDRDIRWIMQENLKKKRLLRLDPAWVEAAQAMLKQT